MPSKNTSILSARLKDEDILTFTNAAYNAGLTVPKLLHAVAVGLADGTIELDGESIKGVTPDELDITKLKKVAKRHKMTPQRLLDSLLEQAER